jgi:arylsulfatase A-like enzyme
MDQPNILFIIVDHMRGDCLGVDGHPVIQTPTLDYLAACGTRFEHAYTPVPSCIPARASIWTGQNQWHTGILGMGWGQGPIPNDYPYTLAGEFSKAGYRTHRIGKGHFHPQTASMGFETFELDESGRTRMYGFEDDYRQWFYDHAPRGVTPDDHGVDWNGWTARPWHTDEHLHPTAWTVTRSIDFLQNRDRSRPFFLNISFARPHSPYVPPVHFFNMYKGRTNSPHVGDWAGANDVPEDALDMIAWRGKKSADQIDTARAGFYGEISFIDNQLGRLLTYMRRFERAALHNTWIVFTSDHGDMQGDHHLWRKTYAYEGSARVPFIIVPPTYWGHTEIDLPEELWNIMPTLMPPVRLGKESREVASEVVAFEDIMPTLLQAAGLAVPSTVDGRSLLPLLLAEAEDWRPYIHGEHCLCYAPEQEMQYVTDGRRKFIWLPRIDVEQFFDLEADPYELQNLISIPDRQDEIEKWRAHLVQELEKRECGWVREGKLQRPPNEPMVSPYKDVRRINE